MDEMIENKEYEPRNRRRAFEGVLWWTSSPTTLSFVDPPLATGSRYHPWQMPTSEWRRCPHEQIEIWISKGEQLRGERTLLRQDSVHFTAVAIAPPSLGHMLTFQNDGLPVSKDHHGRRVRSHQFTVWVAGSV